LVLGGDEGRGYLR